MGEITRLNPTALPAPTDHERIEIQGRRVINLVGRSYNQGNTRSLRHLVADIDAALTTLPTLKQQLTAIRRPATKKELADHLSILRISFPNAKAAGDAFSRVMIERVAAKQPSFGALDWAVRTLIDNSNFLPTIAELLAALAAASASVELAVKFSNRLPGLRDEVAERLAESERTDAVYLTGRAATSPRATSISHELARGDGG